MGWAPDVITSLEPVGETPGDSPGARRVLNGVFHETLRLVDVQNRTIEYSIDDGPGAVAKGNVQGYIGKVRVLPVTDGDHSFVEWSSSWTGGGEGTAEFCNPICHALLSQLKQRFS